MVCLIQRPGGADRVSCVGCRRADTAFKQQRLKAWQPILTPRTVLPTLFIIAIIFAPIGGLLIWGSNKVRPTELTLLPHRTGADLV